MIEITKGQRLKLNDLSSNLNSFQIELKITGVSVDFVCFGLNIQQKLYSDSYMVFFNQLQTPCKAIKLSIGNSNSAVFTCKLDKLPSNIDRLIFTAATTNTHQSMRSIQSGSLNFINSGRKIAQFFLSGQDFQNENAIIFGEIYRKDGVWRFSANGQGFSGGLHSLASLYDANIDESEPTNAPVWSKKRKTIIALSLITLAIALPLMLFKKDVENFALQIEKWIQVEKVQTKVEEKKPIQKAKSKPEEKDLQPPPKIIQPPQQDLEPPKNHKQIGYGTIKSNGFERTIHAFDDGISEISNEKHEIVATISGGYQYGNLEKDTAVYSHLMIEADKALANGDLEAHARAAIAFKQYLSANKTSTQILRGSDSEQIENAFIYISSVMANHKPQKSSTGTAFIVSSNGYALTNYHVIDGCAEVKNAGEDADIKIIGGDKINDIALLKLGGNDYDFAKISRNPDELRQGDEIIVFGYPLSSDLSSKGNLTVGSVSSLIGLENNTNVIQLTAPIQPGSSGSAVINKKGSVVGIVHSTLPYSEINHAILQGVNFAANGQTVKAFLEKNNVPYKTDNLLTFEKADADIAEVAKKWTVLIECWK